MNDDNFSDNLGEDPTYDGRNLSDYRDNTHFRVGAAGQPGDRVFFIELGDYSTSLQVKIEKEQAVALAGFLTKIMDDMPAVADSLILERAANYTSPARPSQSDIDPAFPVGEISVGIDMANQMMVVSLIELDTSAFREATSEELDQLAQADYLAEELGIGEPESQTSQPTLNEIRILIDQHQAQGFIHDTNGLVSKGRKPCDLCGQPQDPISHQCPRLN